MHLPNMRESRDISKYLIGPQLAREALLEKIDGLQQKILKTSGERRDPLEALREAYEQLTDEQKITFLLAGSSPTPLLPATS